MDTRETELANWGEMQPGVEREVAGSSLEVIEPLLAGRFYPAEKEFLSRTIQKYLEAIPPWDLEPPKAIISPHAGLTYSGHVAGMAYAGWKKLPHIKQVVLFGSSAVYDFPGIALPDSQVFKTPLGSMAVNSQQSGKLLRHRFVRKFEAPFLGEHSIELQLPFIQTIFSDALLTPLIVGRAEIGQVSSLIEEIWGGPETRIVISSNLTAKTEPISAEKEGHKNAGLIQKRAWSSLKTAESPGFRALKPFLKIANQKDVICRLALLENVNVAGDSHEETNAFGAFYFFEPEKNLEK